MTIAQNKYHKLYQKYYKDFRKLAKSYEKSFLDLAKEELSVKYKVKKVSDLHKIATLSDIPSCKEPNLYFFNDGLIITVSVCIYTSEEVFYFIRVRNIKGGRVIEKHIKCWGVSNMLMVVEKLLKSKKVKEIKNAGND